MGRVLRFVQRVVICAGALLMVTGTCVRNMHAQAVLPIPAPSMPHSGIPEDWSTRHVIYTRNGSFEDMVKVRDDPRFLNSVLLHNMREHSNQAGQPASTGLSQAGLNEDSPGPEKRKNKHSKRDWAVSLGHFAGMAVGESPAKYTFDTGATPSCSDFVVYTIEATPRVGTQANLIGLTNLYSGTSPTGICGKAPTFLFSYAIGSGPSELSPVLSLDGTKVAWLENTSSNIAALHVTTFVAGQGTSATGGSVAIGSGGSSDVAIDYTSLTTLSGCSASPNTNTSSDLYVDYPSDTGYVSADNGILYHISGIFNGTPTFDFCIPVNTDAPSMSGTVYDSLLGEVFVSDSQTLYAYSVGPTSYTLAASYPYAVGPLSGPGPLLDAFNGYVYMFSADDNIGNTSMTQLPTSLASAVVVPLGPASEFTVYPILYYGTFDNNYLTNGPANAASTVYSCGTDLTNPVAQDLFAISFDPITGLANTTPAMSYNTNVNPGGVQGICSPITEFFDGSTDRVFVGMGNPNGADGANVVTMWDVTTQLTNTSGSGGTMPVPAAFTASSYFGGTTGFAIDNNASGTAQAESVYFSTLFATSTTATCGTNHFCAVKLTQGGLK